MTAAFSPDQTPRQILVTGGAGFIGSNVVKVLRHRYPASKIRVLHLPKENLLNLQSVDGIELMSGDLLNPLDVRRAVQGCDVVFHLAAVYALWLPDMSLLDRVNVDGSRLVLEECVKQGVQRVVHTSSFAVFAGQGLDTACTERSSFALADSHYSRTKYESHRMAESYARKGLDVVLVCPTCPVGPGDVGPTPTGSIITEMFKTPIAIALRTEANYIDVRDCAMGHVLALEMGRTGESYILGGENYTHEDIVRRCMRLTGIKRPLFVLPPDALKPIAVVATLLAKITKKAPFTTTVEVEITKKGLITDASKARRELGLTVRPIEETLKDAISWFVQHGYITDKALLTRMDKAPLTTI
ncbi:MAG: NAD-dependent epimerase/dehydratase family protein [Moraxellaceae bacterium]|nr:NAD-dependent epimerase/dehydratase family protein [Moraxellaceae bacterium]MBP9046618.1 NAD-dependent epimerase/dehydratase family protein [Moraxellaceae bacterium]MBP9731205.1 NAD-dependent epimerase/dehydratase family protein [Moraxellaceae bacterium]